MTTTTPGAVPTAPLEGWHWPEWAAELVGTAFLMFAVVTAKDFAIRAGEPYSHLWDRIVIVALVAGAVVVVVARSPLGRRSGAHLNPAVTVGLWVQGNVSHSDLAGYAVAQTVGALLGVAAARVWGHSVSLPPASWARIEPSVGIGAATAIEAAATFAQLALVFWLLTSVRGAVWAAPVAGASLTVAIIALATTTGAAFNPIRGLAPDLVSTDYTGLVPLTLGPVVGGVMAGLLLRALAKTPVTGKLTHDPSVPCFLGCQVPHLAADRPTSLPTQGARP